MADKPYSFSWRQEDIVQPESPMSTLSQDCRISECMLVCGVLPVDGQRQQACLQKQEANASDCYQNAMCVNAVALH